MQRLLPGLRALSQLNVRSYHVPYVLETTAKGERGFDIYSRLLRDRIICVHGPVDDHMANSVVAQLLFLESEHPEKPVGRMSISSLTLWPTLVISCSSQKVALNCS